MSYNGCCGGEVKEICMKRVCGKMLLTHESY